MIKINKNLILEAFAIDNQAKAQTFARRGIKATNPGADPHIFALPYAGAIGGGAIGNQIHGSDGVDQLTGIVYDPQSNNDDEYDLTGAVLGGLAGTAGTFYGGASGNQNRVKNRFKKHGYNLSPSDFDLLKRGANIAQFVQTVQKSKNL